MTKTPLRLWAFAFGLFTSLSLALLLTVSRSNSIPDALPPADVESQRLGPEIDLQEDGPLANGKKVPLAIALAIAPYSVPVPPTNAETQELTGIWIDESNQIAFVWASDLRFYVNQLEEDSSEAEIRAGWAEKEDRGEDQATGQDVVILNVNGHPAIGYDANAKGPSSLTSVESSLSLQFVSPNHSLNTLQELAEKIVYRES